MLEFIHALDEDVDTGTLPHIIAIDGRLDKHEELANVDVASEQVTSTMVDEPIYVNVEGPIVHPPIPELISPHLIDGQADEPTVFEHPICRGVRWSQHLSARATSEVLLVRAKSTTSRRKIDATRAKMGVGL